VRKYEGVTGQWGILLIVVNFVFFVVIAAGINRVVLRLEPAAPRSIFPPAIALRKGT